MDAKMITAIAVAVILSAGAIGLAYAYTATTENADNTASPAYIWLEQSEYKDSFKNKLAYKTMNRTADYSDDLYYEFVGVSTPSGAAVEKTTLATNVDGYALGSVDVTAMKSGSLTETVTYSLTCKMSAGTDGALDLDDYSYYFGIDSTYVAYDATAGAVFTGLTAFDSAQAVTLYIVPPETTATTTAPVDVFKDVTVNFQADTTSIA